MAELGSKVEASRYVVLDLVASVRLNNFDTQVMHQLELLKPSLRELARSNEGREEDNPLGLVGLGNSQWLVIGSVIGAE